MNYWRMQLHPAMPTQSVLHAVKALGLGYIGLDFAHPPPGDLTDVERESIPKKQRDYWEFAHKMSENDLVLVVAHHYPCALVRITGGYNYIRSPRQELGVWFRHFRRVEVLGYYADFVVNPSKWEETKMTDTISVLNSQDSKSYQLIKRWAREVVN